MQNKRVSAAIFKNDEVLLLHRIKDGVSYFVLPGGSPEAGESDADAIKREIKEETGLDAAIGKPLWKIIDDHDKRVHFVFLVTEFSGNLELGGPEKERQSENNRYILEWHNKNNLKELDIYPEELKNLVSSPESAK